MRQLGLRALPKLTELMQRILKPRPVGVKTYAFLATRPLESYSGVEGKESRGTLMFLDVSWQYKRPPCSGL